LELLGGTVKTERDRLGRNQRENNWLGLINADRRASDSLLHKKRRRTSKQETNTLLQMGRTSSLRAGVEQKNKTRGTSRRNPAWEEEEKGRWAHGEETQHLEGGRDLGGIRKGRKAAPSRKLDWCGISGYESGVGGIGRRETDEVGLKGDDHAQVGARAKYNGTKGTGSSIGVWREGGSALLIHQRSPQRGSRKNTEGGK